MFPLFGWGRKTESSQRETLKTKATGHLLCHTAHTLRRRLKNSHNYNCQVKFVTGGNEGENWTVSKPSTNLSQRNEPLHE